MAAASPISPFAAILRRSKFASYDPAIGQVYTSYGGHLHRGNWGLKRPLPLRRRDAHITVKAVDSKEEQTEWKPADAEARFAKMWDVVGITPEVSEAGRWHMKLGQTGQVVWKMDTEFASSEDNTSVGSQSTVHPIYGPNSSAFPNIEAMSDREFKRYLDKLRKARPEFAEYLKLVSARRSREAARSSGKNDLDAPTDSEFTSFWESSFETQTSLRSSSQDFKMFLGSRAHAAYNSPDSRVIEQQPQTYAGLTYAKSSPLQPLLLYLFPPGTF